MSSVAGSHSLHPSECRFLLEFSCIESMSHISSRYLLLLDTKVEVGIRSTHTPRDFHDLHQPLPSVDRSSAINRQRRKENSLQILQGNSGTCEIRETVV
jgi:hypothetical protein